MAYRVKIVAQLEDIKTGEIVEEALVQTKNVKLPKMFDQLGLRHQAQVELIQNAQDFILKFECELLSKNVTCPKCGGNTRKQGKVESDFHDVYTDHKVVIQRLSCSCGWRNNSTLNSIYGSAIHPELAQLQAKHAANNSFEKACQVINDFSCAKRKINNRATITRTVSKIGDCLNEYKNSLEWTKTKTIAKELILVVDGGHVQDRDVNQHSFEEMVSTVFKPEDLVQKTDARNEIKNKISVASAKKDKQHCIKKLTKHACLRSGMIQQTHITALTDGAKNCWSIVSSLTEDCAKILKILDWFHIGKYFKEREHKIPESFVELYNKGKWHCWHGRPLTAITRLNQLIEKLSDVNAIDKVREVIRYIQNNQENIINYHHRKLQKLPYSSQVAETSINCIINDRQKNKKMQWSRKGAHHILQIRTSLYSKTWQQDWDYVKTSLYKKTA